MNSLIIGKLKYLMFSGLIFSIFSIEVLGSQATDSLTFSKIIQVTPVEADSILKEDTSSKILDIRTAAEFAASHIPGSILIPVQELENRISEIAHLKNTQVLVYCRSGNRSKKALEILQRNGFSKLIHLENGILSWMKEGFKVE